MNHGTAYLYIRTSSLQQSKSGLGELAQLRACQETFDSHYQDYKAEIHIDSGFSGSLPALERPALAVILQKLKAGDVIITNDDSRLSRVLADRCFIDGAVEQARASIHTVIGGRLESDPASILTKNIFASIAEYNLHQIRLRTKKALQEKKSQGYLLGRQAHYGWEFSNDRKSLKPLEAEQYVLELITNHRKAGNTWNQTANLLNTAGYRTRSAREWSYGTLYNAAKKNNLLAA